ncbi:hypothetical protein ARMA_1149 [Ardenticatena maritima]|uniref:Uncharacterized protein n=1 Tax=Ardenticatena maritima TaxID=872965 RepID=A0A0M8K8Z1_9CHLR|nr:hypothetical protein ARMA_1149 [Ardenticatena maritima]
MPPQPGLSRAAHLTSAPHTISRQPNLNQTHLSPIIANAFKPVEHA